LDFIPQLALDDRRMLTPVGCILVGYLTQVDAILQDPVQMPPSEGLAAVGPACPPQKLPA
jgi:hypothetical protein